MRMYTNCKYYKGFSLDPDILSVVRSLVIDHRCSMGLMSRTSATMSITANVFRMCCLHSALSSKTPSTTSEYTPVRHCVHLFVQCRRNSAVVNRLRHAGLPLLRKRKLPSRKTRDLHSIMMSLSQIPHRLHEYSRFHYCIQVCAFQTAIAEYLHQEVIKNLSRPNIGNHAPQLSKRCCAAEYDSVPGNIKSRFNFTSIELIVSVVTNDPGVPLRIRTRTSKRSPGRVACAISLLHTFQFTDTARILCPARYRR